MWFFDVMEVCNKVSVGLYCEFSFLVWEKLRNFSTDRYEQKYNFYFEFSIKLR